MRYSLNTEIKRLINKKTFLIIFFIFMLLSIFVLIKYENKISFDYNCEIAIINLDKGEKSIDFINNLESKKSIRINKKLEDMSNIDETKKMIEDSKLNTCVIIPKDFFKNLPESKLKLIYAEGDVLSPALIDIISQSFINDVAEKVMYNRIENQYDKKSADKSLESFEDLKGSNFFDLEIQKESYNSLKGMKDKVSIDNINGINAILMYIITFNFLFVGLSVQTFRKQGSRIIARMKIINNANLKYFIASNIVSIIIISMIPLIAIIVATILLKIKLLSALYMILWTILINILLFEFMDLFTNLSKNNNSGFLINVTMIILLSLVGGAFFSIDIFPKEIIKIASISPFYTFSSVFYESIEANFAHNTIALIYLVVITSLFIINYKLVSNSARIR